MNDRMTVANKWQTGKPEPGRVVSVWLYNQVREARWDGKNWIDERTGQILFGVTYWMEVPK